LEDQIESFERFKQELTNLSSLAPPQLGKEFVIYTDASDAGIGGVIEKDGNARCLYSLSLKID